VTPSKLFVPEKFNIGIACTEPGIDGFSADQTAIIVDRGHADSEHISYAKLASKSNRFANALDVLDISYQDRVMLWLPNCIEFPVAFFGILKLGAIAVPSSILLTGEEIDYLANDSGAKILVTTTALWHRFQEFNPEGHPNSLVHIVLIDELADEPAPMIPFTYFNDLIQDASPSPIAADTRADDPAYLVYTSGTTGFPKGVLHAHRALIGRSPSAQYWFDYLDNNGLENDSQKEACDRILHSGKFNWTYVLGTALMDPLFLGKTVVVYEGDNDAETWPRLIAKHRCTIFIGVPTIYRQIVQKTDFSAEDVPTLRHCMCAGEHLSDEMLTLWNARFKQEIYEAIGMSECSYYLSQHPSRPIRPGSAGIPQPGHLISLLDENMQAVEDETEGMLCISLEDPGLFIEYWGLPEVTNATRRSGYFLTGDYAKRDRDGYIWFLGRKDDIINSFGFRISPHEIERVIKTHADVSDCVAIEEAVSTDKNLVVICVIANTGSQIDETELLQFSEAHLAKYKVPKKVYFMNDFPRTANGKIVRKSLKAQFAQG